MKEYLEWAERLIVGISVFLFGLLLMVGGFLVLLLTNSRLMLMDSFLMMVGGFAIEIRLIQLSPLTSRLLKFLKK